jgi:hypothetical protein
VSVLTELDAFYTEHRRCGDLDAGVGGEVVWIACDCGARMARRVEEADDPAELDLDPRGPPHRQSTRRDTADARRLAGLLVSASSSPA